MGYSELVADFPSGIRIAAPQTRASRTGYSASEDRKVELVHFARKAFLSVICVS